MAALFFGYNGLPEMRKALSLSIVVTLLLLFLLPGRESEAHNVGDAILWNREISRIFYQRCGACHRDGGTSFSLMNFREVQPHAARIKELVLTRRMPPWGAVKGFGDFRNDQGLSSEEMEMITDWVDSDTPRGNNPNVLPAAPKFQKPDTFKLPKEAIEVSGPLILKSALRLDGIFPAKVPPGNSVRIVAVFHDGHVEPLLWLYEYDQRFAHPFLLKKPLTLPAGTKIQGVPSGTQVFLIPGK
jgi:mono/diheme cytochrome c family protein